MKNYLRNGAAVVLTSVAAFSAAPTPAGAQEAFLGEMRFYAGVHVPKGWAPCNGQELRTSQYPALASILGSTYGGDGVNYFALPDMRWRIPIHPGYGPNGEIKAGHSGGDQNQLKKDISGESWISNNSTLMVNCIIAIDGFYPTRY